MCKSIMFGHSRQAVSPIRHCLKDTRKYNIYSERDQKAGSDELRRAGEFIIIRGAVGRALRCVINAFQSVYGGY